MQIERNTESETDLEKVHNLRLAWCAFRALSVRGPGERNSSVSFGRMDTRIAPVHGREDGACTALVDKS